MQNTEITMDGYIEGLSPVETRDRNIQVQFFNFYAPQGMYCRCQAYGNVIDLPLEVGSEQCYRLQGTWVYFRNEEHTPRRVFILRSLEESDISVPTAAALRARREYVSSGVINELFLDPDAHHGFLETRYGITPEAVAKFAKDAAQHRELYEHLKELVLTAPCNKRIALLESLLVTGNEILHKP